MTFVEYLIYVDIPVSLATFFLILLWLQQKAEKKVNEEAEEDYDEDEYETIKAFENGVETIYKEVKLLPKWLLKASYKQLIKHAKNNKRTEWSAEEWALEEISKLDNKIDRILKNTDDKEIKEILKTFLNQIN